MQLAKLELFGFKSFADKTEFGFEPGITAFVGPNGCGKSNIVDAMKWVLGEQSAKSLRGNEMLDVIFNGSTARRSLGYAECSLTIRNNKGLLPIEYTEVCITRRLFRSGESEYLLNKQPVRLKDIRELFMDTGVGASVYSVIEQGQVAWLLEANAQERRFVFEEAAGISRYKAKKKAALARLERVTQNLLRLGDIIDEVDKQLRSVKIQAAKAVRFKEMTERMRQLRIAASLNSYKEFEAKKEAASGRIHEMSEAELRMKGQIGELENEIAQIEARIAELDAAWSAAQTEGQTVDGQISAAREKVVFEQQRIAEATETEQRHRGSLESLKTRIAETRQELSDAQQEAGEAVAEIERCRAELGKKADEVNQAGVRCGEISRAIEEKKGRVMEVLQQDTRLQNEMARLESDRMANLARRGRIEQRQGELRTEAGQIEAKKLGLSAERDTLSGQLDDNRKRFEDLNAQLASARETMETLRHKLEDVRQRKAAVEKHRDLLQELEAKAEGVEAGVKAILAEARREDGAIRGVKGMVADLVRVELPLALAIEAALGERAQYVVVETTEQARAAIDYLQKNRLGRAGFIPMDRIRWGDGITAQLLKSGRVLHKAVDLVDFDPQVGKVFHYLLGGAVIVENLRTAMEISSNGGSRMLLVTMQGDRVEPRGTILGGTQIRGGIISRKSELIALEKQLVEITAQIEHLEWDIRQEGQRIQQLTDEAGLMQRAIEEGNISRLSKENEIKQCDQRLARIAEEMGVYEADLKEIAASMEEAARREAEVRQASEGLAAQRKALEDEVAQGLVSLREQEALRERLNGEMTTVKVAIAQAEEKKQNLQATMDALENDILEREEQIGQIEKEIALCAQKREEAQGIIREKEAEQKQLAQRKQEVEARMTALRQERDGCRQRYTALQEQVKALRAEHEKLAEGLGALRLEESELQMKMTNLSDRMREEYQVELKDLPAEAMVVRETRRRRRRAAVTEQNDAVTEGRGDAETEDTATEEDAEEEGSGVGVQGSGTEGTTDDAETRGPGDAETEETATEEDAEEESSEVRGQSSETETTATDETPEGAEGAVVPWEAVQVEVEELRGKLARMGGVNLEAIQEQTEMEQRHLFLKKQHEDLTTSKGHLESIIQKINRTSRELFEQTFNTVRANFQALFKKLFGGGSADVKLEEGPDILDAGIEVVARPPGKEPRSLSLLSGGEKTMTTVALLFAIFQAKPSPFCILDEVDAALDESNIERFVLLLKEFVEQSQFLIITHSKKTMSIADVMYGITMQDTGVSKKVSVKFENGAEQRVA